MVGICDQGTKRTVSPNPQRQRVIGAFTVGGDGMLIEELRLTYCLGGSP
jgi:hypothetical protein